MKNVIITGANGGLGVAVTNGFLQKGYTVIATVRSEKSKDELPEHPALHVHILNLNDEEGVVNFVRESIEKFGQVHAALMLAGGFAMGEIADTGMKNIRQQFDLNFETAYTITHPLLEHMMERGSGRLVYIGARPALSATYGKNVVAYALSKSLLFKLAEFINAATKGKNITATVIVPSIIDTPQNRAAMPEAHPDAWVQPAALAEMMEMIVSEKGSALREVVLKAYGDS